MRKKQKSTAIVSASDSDFESSIRSYREFFDYLLGLIPEKFYLPSDEDSKPWFQGLSKAAKASLKQQSKANLKLARRRKFDPDAKLHSAGESEVPEKDGAINFEEDGSLARQKEENSSVTYEELRQKLRRKIELMRGNRGGENGEKGGGNKKAKNFDGKKRKRDEENAGGVGGDGVELQDDDDGEEIIEYGKVALDDHEESKNKKKKRKLSKVKELERAQKSQETKRGNPGLAERETWKAAADRAMGVKVHDDARLIKESMRKEKRKKEKNAEKWKARVATQEKMKGERQQKRKDNIAGRINDKKMRKIAKREKKLMRPGFEGRKDNYITQV